MTLLKSASVFATKFILTKTAETKVIIALVCFKICTLICRQGSSDSRTWSLPVFSEFQGKELMV